MNLWLPLFLLAPLAGSVAAWLVRRSSVALRGIAFTVASLQLFMALRLLVATMHGERWVHGFGGWASPYGIVFAADRLSATFLVLTSILLPVALGRVLARPNGTATVQRTVPLLFALTAGLSGAFMTSDLFNLFVMFELVLLSSYLLLQVPGSRISLRRAFPVVAVNLVASLLFFIGVAVLYAAIGSVSFADLAERSDNASPALLSTGGALLIVAFATKAALVPFLAWLPWSYPVLDGAVAAFFSGLMTKLGVYALLRTVPLLFSETWIPDALVLVGASSAVLGVIAALAQYELRRLLGFHIVSQVGYMVLGLGLSSVIGLAGAVFYLMHHVLVKSALFLVADDLERRTGAVDLRAMKLAGGLAPPLVLAGLFLLAGLSLAGVPPLSGFLAKIGLFRAALAADSWILVAALILASFGTLASMGKVWSHVFAGHSGLSRKEPVPWALVAVVAVSLLVAAFAGPVWEHAVATAEQLRDGAGYIDAVRSAAGRGMEGYPGGLQ